MREQRLALAILAATAFAGVAWAQAPATTTTAPTVTAPAAHAAPAGAAATPAASSHAAPGVSLPTHPLIEPDNDLERSFIQASDHESQRAIFRQEFLAAQVALALSSNTPEAPPASITAGANHTRMGLIFTSSARMTEVMGENAPRAVVTGREALERLRGGNVMININLRPRLFLDAPGIEAFLHLPEENETAPAPVAPEAPSTGPAQ